MVHQIGSFAAVIGLSCGSLHPHVAPQLSVTPVSDTTSRPLNIKHLDDIHICKQNSHVKLKELF